ncbi:MAG: hypothetical protein R3E12_11440 [Candidatus Eisenbacteria bacterium]
MAPAVLGVLAIHRLNHWPDPFRALLDGVKQNTVRHHLMGTPEEVDRITRTFQHDTILFVVICAVAILLLVALRLRCQEARVAVGGAIVLELVIFGCGFAPQGRPALYLPPIGPLDSLETADRVLCANCLPPNLNQRFGFRDVRGYDGVDPARLMDLLDLCRDPKIPVPPYGRAQYFVPVVRLTASHEAAVSPILSLANVQVLVFRGTPPASAVTLFHRDDYWAMANPRACPRAFVPARVETVVDAGSRLAKMGNPDFDPCAVAYVETNLDLPGPCSGQATIVDATRPSRLDIHAEMATPGLLVVSDLWDDGWSAEVNVDRPRSSDRSRVSWRHPSSRASDIQMSYRPRSFRDGLFAMIGAVAVTLVWSASASPVSVSPCWGRLAIGYPLQTVLDHRAPGAPHRRLRSVASAAACPRVLRVSAESSEAWTLLDRRRSRPSRNRRRACRRSPVRVPPRSSDRAVPGRKRSVRAAPGGSAATRVRSGGTRARAAPRADGRIDPVTVRQRTETEVWVEPSLRLISIIDLTSGRVVRTLLRGRRTHRCRLRRNSRTSLRLRFPG